MKVDITKIKFDKNTELVPAVIQHAVTKHVIMLGYMNEEAIQKTLENKEVTFFSRSKNRIWVKGENSGNKLIFKSLALDCDQDSLLIQAMPTGNICHKGTDTCWDEGFSDSSLIFLDDIENIIDSKLKGNDENSYIKNLSKRGISKVAQKVGEEAVELVIESVKNNEKDFKNEAADLLFHYLVLLQKRNYRIRDILKILRKRNQKAKKK